MHNSIYFSDKTNPYFNLALEETLLAQNGKGVILYLWQNENTVVIGKNQNAWKECRLNLLEQEGGKLARRSSGGGAVFHDLGNINFTFVTPKAQYDVKKQLSVIQRAAAAFEIQAEFTGRNDLVETGSGAKFSGNAFQFTDTNALHHGTVLVDADMEKLSRYLAPAPDKLKSKGIESIRARVINLKQINPSLTIKGVWDALVDAFVAVYGPANLGQLSALPQEELIKRQGIQESWEWRVGRTPSFDIMMETRFPWGSLELQLTLKKGHIEQAQAYSDAMEETFIAGIPEALIGAAFRSEELSRRFMEMGGGQARDIAGWIQEKGF